VVATLANSRVQQFLNSSAGFADVGDADVKGINLLSSTRLMIHSLMKDACPPEGFPTITLFTGEQTSNDEDKQR
jgi:hypothetical protein